MTAFLLAVLLLQPWDRVDLKLDVGGTERTAMVYRPNKSKSPTPVVFVFHGFTGSAGQAAVSYGVHRAWPEAITIYPQGLEVSLLGRQGPGWQIAGGIQGDRDLKFYDALLTTVQKEHRGDPNRVFTCGMSNGAIFSYLLLAKRGDTLAAAAPVAGFAPVGFQGAPPKPVLIIHGKNDDLIRLNAAERSRDAALSNNKPGSGKSQWAEGFVRYGEAKAKNTVIWNIHDGGHVWPAGTTDAIVRFFKEVAATSP